MKKQIRLIMLLFSIPLFASNENDSCDCEATGRSTFVAHPHYHLVAPELVSAFRCNWLHAREEDGKHGALQFALYGSNSTNQDNLRRFLTPFCKQQLIVDERIEELEKDILSKHFNIFTNDGNFRSIFSFEPKQSVIGLGITYKQSFCRDEEQGRGFWFSISGPISRVKNSIEINEEVINDGGGPNENADVEVVANMRQAFAQSEWEFSRIVKKSERETKLADIDLKIGYEWLDQEPYHLESYAGVLIPTGNTVNSEVFFQPVAGFGKHFGVIFGSAAGCEIWCNENYDSTLRLEIATQSQYLFKKTHIRPIDLNGKPWTRFIELYKDVEQAQQAADMAETDLLRASNLATPGINLLTLPVKVTPGFFYNVNTAFVYSNPCFHAEVGYNFFARRSDCIKLDQPFQETHAIKHNLGQGQTNPVRDLTGNPLLETINPVPLDQYESSILRAKDLNLESAAMPCYLSHTFYGALGWHWDEREFPTFVDAGASYEFSSSNKAVLDRWTLWGKFGFAF